MPCSLPLPPLVVNQCYTQHSTRC